LWKFSLKSKYFKKNKYVRDINLENVFFVCDKNYKILQNTIQKRQIQNKENALYLEWDGITNIIVTTTISQYFASNAKPDNYDLIDKVEINLQQKQYGKSFIYKGPLCNTNKNTKKIYIQIDIQKNN